jgi:Domain of unknown function (DUF1996)
VSVRYCALLLLAVVAALPASAASATKLHGNNFYANCRFSHTSNDDPIVYPGQPGRSHAHTFFGNRTTDAASTPGSLRGARTTCRPRADKAAYWVPTLYQDGREVRPAKGQFYYNLRGFDRMRPFPAGLKMVAGDAHAHHPQSTRIVYWTCGGSAGVRFGGRSSTAPETCPVVRTSFKALFRKCPTCPVVRRRFPARIKTFVELHVNFPDCWDGKRLDSPDHHSHMAHSRGYVCPATHPVKVPLIRLLIRYPITDGRGLVLASGGQLTGHADFVNAWDQRVLERLVDDCFHDRPCDPNRSN